MEILLKGVKKRYLNRIVGGFIKFGCSDVISSYFFDKKSNKEMVYADIVDLETYFKNLNTCNIFVKEIQIGMALKEVLILIAYDETQGEIELSFLEEQFELIEEGELKNHFSKMIQYIVTFCEHCEIDDIIVGYEPAEDDDRKILEIRQGQIANINENLYSSRVVRVFHEIGRKIL